jgi:hypothetical protein
LPVVSAFLVAGAAGVVRGAPDLAIEVAYVGLDAASLGDDDLRVVRLGEGDVAVAISGAPVPDGAGIRQRYRLPAPGGFWDDTDGGTYRIEVAPDGLRSSTGAVLPAAALGQFTVTIPPPRIDVLDASVDEPASGTAALRFPVRLSASTGRIVTAMWATSASAAQAGSDFISASGAVSIPPGGSDAIITVTVLADREDEPDEGFLLVLTDPEGALAGRSVAVGGIRTPSPAGPTTGSSGSGGGGGCGAGSLSAVWILLAGGLAVLRLRGRRG